MNSEELAQKWRHFKATGDQDVRNELIEHYQPLVVYVARRAVPNAPAYQDREEFESFGYFGLIDAVEKFDPGTNANAGSADYSLGRAFESYAMRRIHGAILDGLRRADPLTRSTRKLVKTVDVAFDELVAELNRHPTVEEIAERLEMSPDQVRLAVASQKTLESSLQRTDEDEADAVIESLTDVRYDRPDMAVEVGELQELVSVRLAALPEKDLTFAVLYYCEQLSLTEIGSLLGISESRVGQIRLRVMRQLRGLTGANARYEL